MKYNTEKLDEVVLALLYLTSFNEGDIYRAWKGHNWDTMERLHKKGVISDPKSKAKSVVFTGDGFKRAQDLFQKYFGTE